VVIEQDACPAPGARPPLASGPGSWAALAVAEVAVPGAGAGTALSVGGGLAPVPAVRLGPELSWGPSRAVGRSVYGLDPGEARVGLGAWWNPALSYSAGPVVGVFGGAAFRRVSREGSPLGGGWTPVLGAESGLAVRAGSGWWLEPLVRGSFDLRATRVEPVAGDAVAVGSFRVGFACGLRRSWGHAGSSDSG
jgi:hypothetical protein